MQLSRTTLQSFKKSMAQETQRNKVKEINIQDENIAARRSAAESITISRATLEMTLAQGEKLEHCKELQERNKYIVEKSGRLVRGMTWSGWIMNAFSKDSAPPIDRAQSESMKEKSTVSQDAVSHVLRDNSGTDVPEELRDQARMLQNYECNVALLKKCQTKDELDTLLEICKSLKMSTRNYFTDAVSNHREGHMRLNGGSLQVLRKLERKFEHVEDLQFRTEQNLIGKFQMHTQTRRVDNFPCENNTKPPSSQQLWANTNDANLQKRIDEQDQHLDILAGSIQELLHNGASIGTSLEQQHRLIDTLDLGADDLREHTKMVTRRADRLSHRSLWRSPKSDYKCSVTIQHTITKKYLSVEPMQKNKMTLHDDLHPDLCIFEMHERRGSNLVGFVSKCTRTWLGQSTLGYITCNAKKFGRNEEWEIDDVDMSRTKIICASANWGNGGWLKVDETKGVFSVTNYVTEAKLNASEWSITIVSED